LDQNLREDKEKRTHKLLGGRGTNAPGKSFRKRGGQKNIKETLTAARHYDKTRQAEYA